MLVKNNEAEFLDAEVITLKTRAQRGKRCRVPILAIQIRAHLAEEKTERLRPHKDGCIICCLGGDQIQNWAQKLTIKHCNVSLEQAKLVFELYNRMRGEYEENVEAPNYAGLDNLDGEILTARAKMHREMRHGLDYSSNLHEENDECFSQYMIRMVKNEPQRYGILNSMISGYSENFDDPDEPFLCANNPADVLNDYTDDEAVYCWWNMARIPETEFDEIGDGYSHWYDVCELYGPGELPFDLTDEELVSIFGFGKFEAFADLSYGC